MRPHAPSFPLLPSAVSLAALCLAGCISPTAGPSGRYARPIGDAPVTANPTPYSPALACLANASRTSGAIAPRIAVGRIADYTGKEESDGSGRKLTQGASLMAISALAKAGARLVERYDTSVSELELKYANNKLISDPTAPPAPGAAPSASPGAYRRIAAGQVAGSDFYLVGGITELNLNIRSAGADLNLSNAAGTRGGLASGKLYVMNVGVDLRLVSTQSLEVVDVISYQKQIIGREVGAGLVDFWGGRIFNIAAGEGALEPMQMAVRSLIERGVVEMMANLYGVSGPEVCLSAGADPLSPGGLTGAYYPAYPNLESNNGQTRADPNRWSVPANSRGRY